jgi:transcriptional regulator with XRE-family HTH domain
MLNPKKLRQIAGLSRADFARRVGLSTATVFNCENQWPNGPTASTVAILKHLGWPTLQTADGLRVAEPFPPSELPGMTLGQFRRMKGWNLDDFGSRIPSKPLPRHVARDIEDTWPELHTKRAPLVSGICDLLSVEVYYALDGRNYTTPKGLVPVRADTPINPKTHISLSEVLVYANITQSKVAKSLNIVQGVVSMLMSGEPAKDRGLTALLCRELSGTLGVAILITETGSAAVFDPSSLPSPHHFRQGLSGTTFDQKQIDGTTKPLFVPSPNPRLHQLRAACVEHDVTAVFLPSGKWGFVDNMAL